VGKVCFTANLERHLQTPVMEVAGETVRETLEAVFRSSPTLRSYILDDQAALRKHVTVFVDGEQIRDRQHLSDPVSPGSEIFIMQALSGG
jgi:molybdopterin converting factor small subunit